MALKYIYISDISIHTSVKGYTHCQAEGKGVRSNNGTAHVSYARSFNRSIYKLMPLAYNYELVQQGHIVMVQLLS